MNFSNTLFEKKTFPAIKFLSSKRCSLSIAFVFISTAFLFAQTTSGLSLNSKKSKNELRMKYYLKTHFAKADFRKLGGVFINDKGVEFYKNMLSSTDSNRVLYVEADIASQLLKSGKPEDAIQWFAKILSSPKIFTYPKGFNVEVKRLLALSHLRLGEQQNCLVNHKAESCIMPLQGKGIYSIQEPVRNAIKLYTEIVNENSFDLESKWLLNISYMTLGLYPDSVPSIYRIPFSTFDKQYPYGMFKDISSGLNLDEVGLSGSVIIDDFDNDNDLDIFTVRLAFDAQCSFYVNNGDGSFTNKTDEAGFTGEVSGRTCIQADYNNDGFLDIFIVRGAWEIQEDNLPPSSLMKNNGNGTFSNVTIESGLLDFLPNYNACWLDYDNDGWIDLFLSNEYPDKKNPHPSKLFRNNGDGTFTEVAEEAGVKTSVWTKGAVSLDYNNDGWQDLYVCSVYAPNFLFKNNGKNESGKVTFTNVSLKAGVPGHDISFYTVPFDYNQDGWIDLYTSKSSFEFEYLTHNLVKDYSGKTSDKASHPRFYKNNGDGTFSEVASEINMNRVIYNMGINYGDIDNDGFPDLYAGTGSLILNSIFPNLMLRNVEGKYFEDVSAASGLAHLQHGHGTAFGDLDNDGDQEIFQIMGGNYSGDLYQNAVYENPGSPNNWIKLKLQGRKTNRAAIGVRVKVNVKNEKGNQDFYSTVHSGGSFGASTLRREIGIGMADRINYVEIYWPGSNAIQRIENLKINTSYLVIEGEQSSNEMDVKKCVFDKAELHKHK